MLRSICLNIVKAAAVIVCVNTSNCPPSAILNTKTLANFLRRGLDDLKRKIAGLNAAGAFSKSLGVPLAYHSHWWEFQSKVGEIEALYRETDPALVSFLLDAGHAYRGGADVPAFLRKHYRRIIGLHLRDYHDGKQVPLGAGSFPLAEVAATLKHLKWKGWVLNEEEREDGTKLGLTVMGPAFEALQKAFPA